MNIQQVFQEVQTASDFELFRLKVAINKLLEDPERTNALRKKLVVGMQLEYFDEVENRSIPCELLEVKRTRALVKVIGRDKRWDLPFYYLNLDHIATELMSNKKEGMSKSELSIGSSVGFISNRDNQEYIGKVVKLNPKRVVISIGNETWAVPYQMIFPVIQSELGDNQTLLPAN